MAKRSQYQLALESLDRQIADLVRAKDILLATWQPQEKKEKPARKRAKVTPIAQEA